MKKKCIRTILILFVLCLLPFTALADGPDLDDQEEVRSGPGMDIAEKDKKDIGEDAELPLDKEASKTVPLLPNYAFSDHRVYDYNAMAADLLKLKENYPSMVLDSLGKTADGREVYHVVIGNPSAKKKILVQGSIHAREYIVTKVVMRELAGLLEMEKNQKTYKGKSMQDLLKNSCIHFVPMLNPDGVTLSQYGLNGIGSEELRNRVLKIAEKEGAKDLHSYFRSWKNNLRGVNLNKNFDANWEQTVDKKGYPAKDEYKGEAVESEIESKALADLARKEHFSSSISYHTQGELVYWYFGEGSYVDSAKSLAQIVARNAQYKISNAYSERYAGGFKDFMERKYNIPSVTIECGKGTSPVPEEQIDKIWEGQRGVLPDLLLSYASS